MILVIQPIYKILSSYKTALDINNENLKSSISFEYGYAQPLKISKNKLVSYLTSILFVLFSISLGTTENLVGILTSIKLGTFRY